MKKIFFKNYKRFLLVCFFAFCQCNSLKKTQTMKYKLNFTTSYQQFYCADKLYQGNTGSDNFWTDESHNDRLAIEKDVLGIRTESYGAIKGELIILDKANSDIDFNLYDHVVEGGLEIKSGVLQILDSPNNSVELEVNITPGNYRVRVYSSNLSSVVDEDENGDDYYKIEIWKDDNKERKVLKRYIK